MEDFNNPGIYGIIAICIALILVLAIPRVIEWIKSKFR